MKLGQINNIINSLKEKGRPLHIDTYSATELSEQGLQKAEENLRETLAPNWISKESAENLSKEDIMDIFLPSPFKFFKHIAKIGEISYEEFAAFPKKIQNNLLSSQCILFIQNARDEKWNILRNRNNGNDKLLLNKGMCILLFEHNMSIEDANRFTEDEHEEEYKAIEEASTSKTKFLTNLCLPGAMQALKEKRITVKNLLNQFAHKIEETLNDPQTNNIKKKRKKKHKSRNRSPSLFEENITFLENDFDDLRDPQNTNILPQGPFTPSSPQHPQKTSFSKKIGQFSQKHWKIGMLLSLLLILLGVVTFFLPILPITTLIAHTAMLHTAGIGVMLVGGVFTLAHGAAGVAAQRKDSALFNEHESQTTSNKNKLPPIKTNNTVMCKRFYGRHSRTPLNSIKEEQGGDEKNEISISLHKGNRRMSFLQQSQQYNEANEVEADEMNEVNQVNEADEVNAVNAVDEADEVNQVNKVNKVNKEGNGISTHPQEIAKSTLNPLLKQPVEEDFIESVSP